MSKCISSHGEYSSHETDELYVCKWCGAFDEAVVLKRLGAAEAERDEALARLAEAERAAAEKAIKALEIELVGSMDDGTFTAPWVEIPAGEIREKIWAVFDSYGAAALGLTAEQEGEEE